MNRKEIRSVIRKIIQEVQQSQTDQKDWMKSGDIDFAFSQDPYGKLLKSTGMSVGSVTNTSTICIIDKRETEQKIRDNYQQKVMGPSTPLHGGFSHALVHGTDLNKTVYERVLLGIRGKITNMCSNKGSYDAYRVVFDPESGRPTVVKKIVSKKLRSIPIIEIINMLDRINDDIILNNLDTISDAEQELYDDFNTQFYLPEYLEPARELSAPQNRVLCDDNYLTSTDVISKVLSISMNNSRSGMVPRLRIYDMFSYENAEGETHVAYPVQTKQNKINFKTTEDSQYASQPDPAAALAASWTKDSEQIISEIVSNWSKNMGSFKYYMNTALQGIADSGNSIYSYYFHKSKPKMIYYYTVDLKTGNFLIEHDSSSPYDQSGFSTFYLKAYKVKDGSGNYVDNAYHNPSSNTFDQLFSGLRLSPNVRKGDAPFTIIDTFYEIGRRGTTIPRDFESVMRSGANNPSPNNFTIGGELPLFSTVENLGKHPDFVAFASDKSQILSESKSVQRLDDRILETVLLKLKKIKSGR
jgi:hypothetical protein